MMSGDALAAAAAMTLFGLPALRFLNTRDPAERTLLLALAEKAAELYDRQQRNLATLIANAMVKARL